MSSLILWVESIKEIIIDFIQFKDYIELKFLVVWGENEAIMAVVF